MDRTTKVYYLIVNFWSCTPDRDSHNPELFNLFQSLNPRVYCAVTFPPFQISDKVAVSVFKPSNSKGGYSFSSTAFDYFCADWGGLVDHLKDNSMVDIF